MTDGHLGAPPAGPYPFRVDKERHFLFFACQDRTGKLLFDGMIF